MEAVPVAVRETRGEAERWLQVAIRILAVQGAIVLGVTQGDPTLPVLSLFACITSYFFTDCWGWFHLNRYVGYVAMIAAAATSLGDFLNFDSYRQLTAISSLLVYVQIVLFYQRKQPRVYEQIGIFCALQIIVGALLSTHMLFAPLVIAYLFVALIALASFARYRERLMIVTQRTSVAASGKQLANLELEDNAPAWRKTLGKGPVAYFPLPALGRESVEGDWRHAAQVLLLAAAALAFALVFFYRTPRHESAGGSGMNFGGAQVGFNKNPNLMEMGQMLLSDRLVMRVWFNEAGTNEPVRLQGEPYFRGVSLEQYEFNARNGEWTSRIRSAATGHMLTEPPADAPLVRQKVVMEPSQHDVLFAVAPAFNVRQTPDQVRMWTGSRQLFWVDDNDPMLRRGKLTYTVGTTAIRYGMQSSLVMHEAGSRAGALELNRLEKDRMLEFDPTRMPRLAALAEEILGRQNIDRSNRVLVARTLRNHFHEPGTYTYTLNLDMRRDPSMDPIEAFVSEHRRGHCQFFASALVMMLRSQNIPARLVIGYRSDEYNDMGNYYLVREKHAHAWVECYLEPEQVPDSAFIAGELGGGGWYRLDPTPGAEETGSVALSDPTLMNRVGNALDYAQLLWQDYVLGRTSGRGEQVEQLLDELPNEDAPDEEPKVSMAERLSQALAWIRSLFSEPMTTTGNLQLAAFVMLILSLAMAIARAKQGVFAKIGWLLGVRHGEPPTKPRVEFYARFEALIERLGARRLPSQTQREFVARVTSALGVERSEHWSPVVERLTELFYQVRFGDHELDSTEQRFVDESLAELELLAKQ